MCWKCPSTISRDGEHRKAGREDVDRILGDALAACSVCDCDHSCRACCPLTFLREYSLLGSFSRFRWVVWRRCTCSCFWIDYVAGCWHVAERLLHSTRTQLDVRLWHGALVCEVEQRPAPFPRNHRPHSFFLELCDDACGSASGRLKNARVRRRDERSGSSHTLAPFSWRSAVSSEAKHTRSRENFEHACATVGGVEKVSSLIIENKANYLFGIIFVLVEKSANYLALETLAAMDFGETLRQRRRPRSSELGGPLPSKWMLERIQGELWTMELVRRTRCLIFPTHSVIMLRSDGPNTRRSWRIRGV